MVEGLTNQQVQETEQAAFTCQLSKPNQKVEWYVGGTLVVPDDRKYSVDCVDCAYTLRVNDCQVNDSADITIRSKDCESSASLTVTGKSA